MATKSKRRKQLQARKVMRKKAMGEGRSNYARKKAWLHGSGAGLWGFQVRDPKPWK